MASDGDFLWTPTVYDFGVKLKAYGAKSPLDWDAVSDFNGGMFVVWSDQQDILWAVHIDHQGKELWRTKDIYSYAGSEIPAIVPDGFGGLFVSWLLRQAVAPTKEALMVQRLNQEGKPQWGILKNPQSPFHPIEYHAVKIFEHGSSPNLPKPEIRSDNTGGVIIACGEGLHHVDGGGKITYSISDLDPGTSDMSSVQITSYGPAVVVPKRFDRGVYAAWRSTIKGEIYAQQYHTNNLKWPNAIFVTKDAGGFRLDYNESKEMLIGWINQSCTKISAQKFDINGKAQWSPGDIVVADSLVDGYPPYIVADRKGGAILVWVDSRKGKPDLYAQRLGPNGIEQWTSGGKLISSNIWNVGVPNYHSNAISTISDGSGGVLIAYQTKYSTNYASWNIVIDRLSSTGNKVLSKNFDSDAFSISPAYDQEHPKVLFDNYGSDPTGAIVIFDDEQEGLCAQKIAVSN